MTTLLPGTAELVQSMFWFLKSKPRLSVRRNLADVTRPVEIVYGDIKVRLTIDAALQLSNKILVAALRKANYASLHDEREDPNETVIRGDEATLLLSGKLAATFADQLRQAADAAAALTHPAELYRAFSRRMK